MSERSIIKNANNNTRAAGMVATVPDSSERLVEAGKSAGWKIQLFAEYEFQNIKRL
jgi:hypothetical protein